MNHFRHIRHRLAALVGLTASIVVLAPAAAQAADLIVTPDGVLHYKADPGRINNVSFDEDLGVVDANPVPAANATRCDSEAAAAVDAVCVTRFADEDPIDEVVGCREVINPANRLATAAQQFVCPAVERVEADALDKDDIITAAGLKTISADIDGGEGNDQLTGGEADDQIDGGSGADTIHGGDDDDHIHGGDGNDTIYGEDGGDDIQGDDGADTIFGGEGDDQLDGGDGDDSVFADGGDDKVSGGDGDDLLFGGKGDDSIEGGDGDDTISANDGNDTVSGAAGADIEYGGDGKDDLKGGTGADTLYGDDGADELSGGDGGDSLYGGDGNDSLDGGLGNDTLAGGDGTDTADYSDAPDNVTVDLTKGTSSGGAGSDTLTSIEKVIGSAFDDVLTGNRADNVLSGGAGNDVLDGDLGDDTENGGDGDDRFDQGDVPNGADTMSGGDGNDTVDYSKRHAAVTVTFDGVANDGEANEGDNALPDVEAASLPALAAAALTPPALDVTAPALADVSVNTTRFSPNDDGRVDAFSVSGRFSAVTQWTFEVLLGSRAIYSQTGEGSSVTATWDGRAGAGHGVLDGAYVWRITGKDAAGNALSPQTGVVTVDRRPPVVRALRISHRQRATQIRLTPSEPAIVTAKIVRGAIVWQTARNVREPDTVTLRWNGRSRRGRRVRLGAYHVVINVVDRAGNLTVRRATITVAR